MRYTDCMLCRYVATYVAHAIALPGELNSVHLYKDATERVSAVLVKDPTELLADADRGAAMAAVVLRGVFGFPDSRDVDAKIAERVAAISKARKEAAREAPFVVIAVES